MKMVSVLTAVVALAFTACKKDDVADPASNPGARQFNVNITDAPANFARMEVTIDGVDAWHDSQGWINLSSSTRSINILSLANGNSASLATASNVQAGHYSRLRIHFSESSSVTVHSAVTIGTLQIAAGGSSAMAWGGPADRYVEVVIDADVTEESGAEVLIDFDAAASVYEGLNTYVLNPSMREMHNRTTGARGTVTGASGAAFVRFSDGTHTYTGYTTSTGVFMTRGMQPGTYVATVWAPVMNEAGVIEERQQTRSDVVVTNNTIVNIGAVHF
jgi:hypothetical protein